MQSFLHQLPKYKGAKAIPANAGFFYRSHRQSRHTIPLLMTSTDFSCSDSSAITHRERERRWGDNSALLWKTRTPHVPWELGFQHSQALPLRPHATLFSSARLDYSYDGRQRWADSTWDCLQMGQQKVLYSLLEYSLWSSHFLVNFRKWMW